MSATLIRRAGDLRPSYLLGELDRILGGAWGEGEEGRSTAAYPVDIHEDNQAVYVEAELPGFKKEEIDVSFEKGVLRIVAERKSNQEKREKGKAHLVERRFTRVSRAFALPADVDDNKVDAKLDEGVLSLKFHKREEVKPRRITLS